MQSDLFAADALPLLEGSRFIEEFLSPHEEAGLIEAVRALPLNEARYKQYTARRRVASFGGQFDYDTNRLRPAAPIPQAFEPLREKIARHLGIEPSRFAHMLVAEYRPGTPLGWHRDVPEFESIVGVSLLDHARMRLRPYPPQPGRSKDTLTLELPPRSLYVLEAAARWKWQHSIVETAALRYSITLRTVRGAKPLLG